MVRSSIAWHERVYKDPFVRWYVLVGVGIALALVLLSRFKVEIMYRLSVAGTRVTPVKLKKEWCTVTGLWTLVSSTDGTEDTIEHNACIVTTFRMGFGHLRLANAMASWVDDRPVYVYDMMQADGGILARLDGQYSKMSRLASRFGGVIEWFWGSLMTSGNDDMVEVQIRIARVMKPLLEMMPRSVVVVATHPLAGIVAQQCELTTINMVIDNHAQPFVLVPGVLNATQGPETHAKFLDWIATAPKRIISPKTKVALAGHWVPRQIVNKIEDDCARRMRRVRTKQKKRLLIAVGGAGGQAEFVGNFVREMQKLGLLDTWQVVLNAGDRKPTQTKCINAMDKIVGSMGYDRLKTMDQINGLATDMICGGEIPGHVVITPNSTRAAVFTTDTLSRAVDLLATKPSELAFYPVPKLLIRRIGNHEARSALRSSELGDGSHELRTPREAALHIRAMEDHPELLILMNSCIHQNAKAGTYEGCGAVARNFAKVTHPKLGLNKERSGSLGSFSRGSFTDCPSPREELLNSKLLGPFSEQANSATVNL
jgi:hypothetical protein